MYLRVKKDSVTSILLFIFNVFLVERGITSVPLRKIFLLLEPFGKSETAIRMGLSRGVQNGLFVNQKHGQEVWYRLTEEAVENFLYWQKTMARFHERMEKQKAGWDGNWSIILAGNSLQNKPDGNPEEFARSLEQLGYGSLGKGQWISPYDLSAGAEALAETHDFKDYLLIFRGSLKNMTPEKAAGKAWPLRHLAKEYRAFAAEIEEAAGRLRSDPGPGRALPFLHNYGLGLFEIIQDDPQLPLELLPADWTGTKAARTFFEIRQQLLPEANRFIDQILG